MRKTKTSRSDQPESAIARAEARRPQKDDHFAPAFTTHTFWTSPTEYGVDILKRTTADRKPPRAMHHLDNLHDALTELFFLASGTPETVIHLQPWTPGDTCLLHATITAAARRRLDLSRNAEPLRGDRPHNQNAFVALIRLRRLLPLTYNEARAEAYTGKDLSR